MKNVIILHGMSCRLEECWLPYLKNQLDAKKIKHCEPKFTLDKDITLENWTTELDNYKHLITKDTIFVCHSLSTLFIFKYLFDRKLKVSKVISVAGGYMANPKVSKNIAEFVPTVSDIKYSKTAAEQVYNIYSNNDHIWTQNEIADYNRLFNASPIFLKDKGHFGRKSGVKELPEIIKLI